jgi:hypothetical protein
MHREGSYQLPRTEGKSRPRHTGAEKAAEESRLGPTDYEIFSICLKDSSVTSVTVQMAFLGGGLIPTPSARGRQGMKTQPPPGAEQSPAAQRTLSDRLRGSAGFLQVKASGRINYHAPSEKSTTHGEGSDQLPRTEGNSLRRHTGVAKAARDSRLGPTFYEVCSFRLKDSSVT